jgi:hypothetical protein
LREDRGEKLSKWKWRERKEKSVLSRTMGLIYFEGESVSGMTIPRRLSNGWRNMEGKNWNRTRDKEAFLKDWNNFSFDFFFSLQLRRVKAIFMSTNNGREDVVN